MNAGKFIRSLCSATLLSGVFAVGLAPSSAWAQAKNARLDAQCQQAVQLVNADPNGITDTGSRLLLVPLATGEFAEAPAGNVICQIGRSGLQATFVKNTGFFSSGYRLDVKLLGSKKVLLSADLVLAKRPDGVVVLKMTRMDPLPGAIGDGVRPITTMSCLLIPKEDAAELIAQGFFSSLLVGAKEAVASMNENAFIANYEEGCDAAVQNLKERAK